MKPARGWIVWSALAVCAVLVIGAMIWMTRGVLAAERQRAQAEQDRSAAEDRADLEERTRLALWRMDALGAAIMLRENRFPANPADNRPISAVMANSPPEVLLRFQIRKGGVPTSPELESIRPEEVAANQPWIDERGKRLQNLRALLADHPLPGDEWTQLQSAANESQASWANVPKDATAEQNFNAVLRQNKAGNELRQDAAYQGLNSSSERVQRAKAVAQTVDNGFAQSDQQEISLANQNSASITGGARQPAAPQGRRARSAAPAPAIARDEESGAIQPPAPQSPQPAPPAAPTVAEIGQMRAIWVGGELFMLRQVVWNPPPEPAIPPAGKSAKPTRSNLTAIQGVWLDAQILRKLLLAEVTDLLPQALLPAVADGQAAQDSLAMVSFPFKLDRNEMPGGAVPLPNPSIFGNPLWVAWAAVALAVLASSLLVRGVMRLSERRASFVSAVTHELRTPLTTFRLYSEMLETGAVKPEKRGHYLRVLSREADRLAHLVENVLAFSRIERGNARSNVTDITIGDLLERSRERLDARLATAGLTLDINSADCTQRSLRVRVDTAAIDHILFNLIDNAAKYASNSTPPQVTLDVRATGRTVEIAVSDHGPGIPPAERARIFQAFHKSAREAAESQPGVGLGLALSRRLAKSQGGDLSCADSPHGARFILRLPAA